MGRLDIFRYTRSYSMGFKAVKAENTLIQYNTIYWAPKRSKACWLRKLNSWQFSSIFPKNNFFTT